MNILICDDVASEAARLEELILKMYPTYKTFVFTSAQPALECTLSLKIDVCFLDIIMADQKIDGIGLASSLRSQGYAGKIVFLSTSNEYAAQSYEVSAFSYLLKPPSEEELAKIMQKIIESSENTDSDGFFINYKKDSRFIMFREILFAEVIQHKVHFYLQDGTVFETRSTFKDYLPLFTKDDRFNWCHRSFVINMDYVTAVKERDFLIEGGYIVPIRSTNLKEAIGQYSHYCINKLKNQ